MSLFIKRYQGATWDGSPPPIPRNSASGRFSATPDQALRHSAVWACQRLRADLESTLPVDLYRPVNGISVERPKPDVLRKPGSLIVGGPLSPMDEWLYATRMDKDRVGNVFGLVIERKNGRPSRIDLLPHSSVVLRQQGAKLTYLVDGKEVPTYDIWHEKQFVVPGLPIGLSPVAYAAMAMGQYMNAQEFAVAWFGGTKQPGGILKNTKKVLKAGEAAEMKARFNAGLQAGDVFVTGADWEYNMTQIAQAQTEFIAAQKFSISDVCRFFGVPGDMIDAETGASNVTYANITQRNVQLLVMNLGPAIFRTERALSTLVADPDVVKLNSKALLRMDPLTQAQVIDTEIKSRQTTPDEARALADKRPLTSAQISGFHDLFGNPNKTPTPGSTS